MHNARAGDFDPLLTAFERFGFHINFQARLCERKIVRTKLNFCFSAEKFAHKEFQRAFQVGDADVFVHVKPFDLVELRAVSGVKFIAPIRCTGSNHTNRRRRGLHRPDLHGGGVGSQ